MIVTTPYRLGKTSNRGPTRLLYSEYIGSRGTGRTTALAIAAGFVAPSTGKSARYGAARKSGILPDRNARLGRLRRGTNARATVGLPHPDVLFEKLKDSGIQLDEIFELAEAVTFQRFDQ